LAAENFSLLGGLGGAFLPHPEHKKVSKITIEIAKIRPFLKFLNITNPHFSQARAEQEQGISARRRSILYFEG